MEKRAEFTKKGLFNFNLMTGILTEFYLFSFTFLFHYDVVTTNREGTTMKKVKMMTAMALLMAIIGIPGFASADIQDNGTPAGDISPLSKDRGEEYD
ncbi:hypothetical protein [Bhargavaea ullalensis]|uniref:Fatty acid desaturase n=1 Tax=Bhargavaea ullalensis TaxID=1265685 RepID=A0ABV2G7C9_9BACL